VEGNWEIGEVEMTRLKTDKEIDSIKRSGRVIAEIFGFLEREDIIKPGVTTAQINDLIADLIRKKGARPAFKGYRGYPAESCISVNQEVVHGIPSLMKYIQEGDIVSVDIGVEMNGFFADAAWTYSVGEIGKEREKLIRVTREALYRGIEQMRVGRRIGDISYTIQQWVERNGCSVVRELFGHGVGFSLHEDPIVPNFGQRGRREKIREGMVLAIEPMVNLGSQEVRVLPDKWTVVSSDGTPSAHFEHTIAAVRGGNMILTERGKKIG